MTLGRVLLVCVALLVAVITAAPSDIKLNKTKQDGGKKACCLPDKMETILGTTQAIYNTKTKEASVKYANYNYAVDADRQKVALQDPGDAQGENAYRAIWDYTRKKLFFILANGVCVAHKFEYKWNMCLPDDSVYLGNYYMGADDEKLNMDAWSYTDYNLTGYSGSISFTKDCVPTGAVSVGGQDQYQDVITQGYLDTRLEITNPSIFDIPKSCDKRQDMFHFSLETSARLGINALPIFLKK